ncbi:recombinase family protein [Sphingomonas oligophenolica]|uniref:Recombinase family protein n=2 Tax=Sphingomonas oligophenolica TaxID=301154 RepID=A0A502BWG6_9SPHN|nr:recombinase family protein [Sphingomonas oligophenolica]
MWMGGTPPLGYRPDGRSLAIVEDHAAVIRDIFARYLDLGNVRLLGQALARERIRVPLRTMTSSGRAFGGVAFTRGQLYAILKRPAYIGEIHHRGSVHTALHPPIIDPDTWDRVQTLLKSNTVGARRGSRAASPSLLAGKVVDAAGQPLVAVHATKGTTRYRYYVSRSLQTGESTTGMRIPARELEVAVTTRLTALFADPLALIGSCWLDVPANQVSAMMARCGELRLSPSAGHRSVVQALVERVQIDHDHIEITCPVAAIAELLQVARDSDGPATIAIRSAVTLSRSGSAMRLVHSDGAAVAAIPNPALVRLLLRARRWWTILRTGEVDTKTLARQEGVNPAYITRVVRLAFLAPAIVDAIITGRASVAVDVAALTATGAIVPRWADQVAMMLPWGSLNREIR